jgi:hypothetical protein
MQLKLKLMSQTVRAATTGDLPRLIELLLLDAAERRAAEPILWKMAKDAPTQIEKALTFALTSEQQPFRQFWQVSEQGGMITGVVHSMLLPVPPIYAGRHGDPGLILSDSAVAPGVPEGTIDALVAAAERALREAGAKILLSAYVTGEQWQKGFQDRGYDPLTLYLSRTDLGDARRPSTVRLATEADVPGIVTRAAENKRILSEIDSFWERHPDADTRFKAWMTRSLTLRDRDMLVIGPSQDVTGYVIAQPASRLHFPPAHDVTGVGVIDDYYHPEMHDPAVLVQNGGNATLLLQAAEAAFTERSVAAAFIVCPAKWLSKIAMLEAAGYKTAMVWSIKR